MSFNYVTIAKVHLLFVLLLALIYVSLSQKLDAETDYYGEYALESEYDHDYHDYTKRNSFTGPWNKINSMLLAFKGRVDDIKGIALTVTAGDNRKGATEYDTPAGFNAKETILPEVLESFSAGVAGDVRLFAASSSKIVSSLIIFALITEGFLNLETTTEEVLGWTGDHAKITVKMLGNMVSGLSNADGYCNNPAVRSPAVNMTLTQCAEYFHTYGKDEKSGGAALRTGGGDRLTYGPSHWYVLASMAEKVSGLSWNQLLEKHIKKPLGLENPDFQFAQWVFDIQDFSRYKYTGKMGNWTMGFNLNSLAPNPAAGLLITMDEFGKILDLISNQGIAKRVTYSKGHLTHTSKRIIDPQLFDLMFINSYPRAHVSPQEIYYFSGFYQYTCGFGTVLFCSRNRDEWIANPKCDVAGMISAFAVIPFMYRHSYNAVLAARVKSGYSIAMQMESLRRDIDHMIHQIVQSS